MYKGKYEHLFFFLLKAQWLYLEQKSDCGKILRFKAIKAEIFKVGFLYQNIEI